MIKIKTLKFNILLMTCLGNIFTCELSAESNCTNGIVIFKEDFGGNSIDDPPISPNALPENVCSYNFNANVAGAGRYSIRKLSQKHSWYQVSDHTYEGNDTIGYLMQVDASDSPGLFYSLKINNLCGGTILNFSMWGVSVYKGPEGTPGSIKMVMVDAIRDTVLESKEVKMENKADNELVNGRPSWEKFEFSFKLRPNETSVIFKLENNGESSSSGNDFCIDDIEIRLCVPPVTLDVLNNEFCTNSPLKITSDFTNDGTFTEPLTYKWLFSKTNENDQSLWKAVGINAPILDIPSLKESDAGYYRLAIAGQGSIDMVNCRSISEPVHISVEKCVPPEPTCTNCPSSFAPIPGKTYIISAWVKDSVAYESGASTYKNCLVSVSFDVTSKAEKTTPQEINPEGNIIDGWQRIHGTFDVPKDAYRIHISLKNETGRKKGVFFDDIRVHPVDGTMKSYVYDPETLRLTAELDEQNYATFYDYDEEGNLIRIRKETEKGIMTIREARQGKPKK